MIMSHQWCVICCTNMQTRTHEPGAVLEEVSHMEVGPSDMKRLMDGQMGSGVQQRHSVDGEGDQKSSSMTITGDERAQIFVVRCGLCCLYVDLLFLFFSLACFPPGGCCCVALLRDNASCALKLLC